MEFIGEGDIGRKEEKRCEEKGKEKEERLKKGEDTLNGLKKKGKGKVAGKRERVSLFFLESALFIIHYFATDPLFPRINEGENGGDVYYLFNSTDEKEG